MNETILTKFFLEQQCKKYLTVGINILNRLQTLIELNKTEKELMNTSRQIIFANIEEMSCTRIKFGLQLTVGSLSYFNSW